MEPISPVARTCVPPQALRSRRLDGDDADRALALRRLAQAAGFARILELNRHRPVLQDDLVGAPLDREHASGIDRAAFEIDGGALGAEVKAHGAQTVQFLEDGGEQVLAGVLLHVIEAAVPIDQCPRLAGRIGGQRRGQAMRDASIVFVRDFDNRDAAECAEVERLPAGSGIEGRAVQVYGCGVGGAVDNAGGELAQVGVGVVEAVGHGDTDIVAQLQPVANRRRERVK